MITGTATLKYVHKHGFLVEIGNLITGIIFQLRILGRVHELLIDSEKSSTSHVFEKNIERF